MYDMTIIAVNVSTIKEASKASGDNFNTNVDLSPVSSGANIHVGAVALSTSFIELICMCTE